MHHRAGRAIKAVLEGAVDEAVRNEAAFRLARIHFQKDQLDDALHALARINGTVPEAITDDVEFLRANVYMATRPAGRGGRGARSAAERREAWPGLPPTTSASRCCRTADHRKRSSSWTRPGSSERRSRRCSRSATSPTWCSAPCCSKSGNFERAKQSLDRVRLEGPFSNQALLRAGWAEASAQNYDRALVPWNILAEREPTDAAVQEAMLAVPHAYAS